ncbi:hypothetical protein [Phenylobacterium deserti]|uniref:Uncharacterized protein n=1 Tax=Phenylobacterium deserti TaxID=1914756 RepID=A0A328AAM0_9CAUL|nr:hypothetical protein [Phenylobacterium deserti]RAK51477.1 hypothetical protein DJ018_16215 [Phenylobacterium deserti]
MARKTRIRIEDVAPVLVGLASGAGALSMLMPGWMFALMALTGWAGKAWPLVLGMALGPVAAPGAGWVLMKHGRPRAAIVMAVLGFALTGLLLTVFAVSQSR